MASVPVSSGTAITRSDNTDSSESCTSCGVRVISSKRTSIPSRIPVYSGAGTSARGVGPSLISRA